MSEFVLLFRSTAEESQQAMGTPERARQSMQTFLAWVRDLEAYPAALGELELRRGNHPAAHAHFGAAFDLARNEAERRYLKKRLQACAVA